MYTDPFGLDSVKVVGPQSTKVVQELRDQAPSFREVFDALDADPNVKLTIRDPQSTVETHGMGSQFVPGSGGSATILFNVTWMNQLNQDLAKAGSSWFHTAGSTMAHEVGHAGGHFGKLPAACAKDPPRGSMGCVINFENKVRKELGGKGGVRTGY